MSERTPHAAPDQPWMEDTPMSRYCNPIPVCTDPHNRNGRDTQSQLDQILLALHGQTQLLIDLLGAVNGLTAAVLADHT